MITIELYSGKVGMERHRYRVKDNGEIVEDSKGYSSRHKARHAASAYARKHEALHGARTVKWLDLTTLKTLSTAKK